MSRLHVDEGNVEALLQLMVALACSSIPGVSDASISLDSGQKLRTLNATSEDVQELDSTQYQTGEGPCVSAIRDGRPYNVIFSEELEHWPTFGASANAAGLHSALSTPMQSRERTLGALNLYSQRRTTFSDAEVSAAAVFAEHAAVVLANAVSFAAAEASSKHLQTALDTARVIGRAQGVIMARERCSSDAAFDVLRRASQRTNRKLREIAEEIVAPLESGETS
jgi:GAF domain-containing protein